jgi:hypothetical protein
LIGNSIAPIVFENMKNKETPFQAIEHRHTRVRGAYPPPCKKSFAKG